MDAPLCACGVEAQGFMSITEANPFRQCNTNKACGLMIWIDKDLDEYYNSVFFQFLRNGELLGKEIDDLTSYACYLKGLINESESDEDKYSMGVESDPTELQQEMHDLEEYENTMAYTVPENLSSRGCGTTYLFDYSNGGNRAKEYQSDKVFLISYGIIVVVAFVLYFYSK